MRAEIVNLKKEIEILKKISHKNIVKYFYTDICEDNSSVDIVFEYVPGGSISTRLGEVGKFNEKLISKYTEQILEGLNYLHSLGIFHRDIKGDNILIDSDSTIKLSDFGSAKLFINEFGQAEDAGESNEVVKKSVERPYWMAPEVALNICPSFPADIWSVGCVVIQMLTGRPPYSNITKQPKEILKLISTGKIPMYPLSISQNCKDFLDSCIKYKPDERKKASELLQLPFITHPASNIPQNNEVSKSNTSNQNDPRNHSSHFLSNSDILLSFFAKSTKQVAGSPPKVVTQGFDKGNEFGFILDEKSKKFQKTKSNVSEGIAEDKKAEDIEEKKESEEERERVKRRKMLEERIKKDAERRKLEKNGVSKKGN